MHYGAVRRRARAGGGLEYLGDVTCASSGRKLERGGEVAASTGRRGALLERRLSLTEPCTT